ncbi:MAG TPA: DUF4276 family protein [Actinomycetes bacterium]|jgi:hypothetical protein|nr:DUF4276 family protein [Actinomycetes bacterium]
MPNTRKATIACIVEGHGEVQALPLLLRRVAAEVDPGVYLVVPSPYRVNRSALLRPGILEEVARIQGNRVTGTGGVLLLIDADDDCPADLAPELLVRTMTAQPDGRVAVVLANREFEAWFLAAAPSLAGHRELPEVLEAPQDPEAIRGAKEWLGAKRAGRPYKETSDQAAFAAVFDMKAAREKSPSFDKFWREAERLLRG